MLKDMHVHDLIEQLRNRYQIFMSNNFIKNYVFEIEIPKSTWVGIEDLLDSNRYYGATGYDLHNLYEQILNFSRFLATLKNEIVPRMQNESRARINTLSENNRVIFKMTVNNAPGNVQTFYELTQELFNTVRQMDESANGKENMVYTKNKYYHEIENLLVS